ncbi:MAG: GT4 family glycosyltransferase PelF [Planctomycetes bacterium]|nr:GT4 family glycosyltransferase PelF [Planctomycetota bacterium]
MNVGLMLEGTYPYVMGGVSGWVHGMIQAMPDITFTIVAIVADPKAAARRKYPPLPNVERVIDIPLYGVPLCRDGRRLSIRDWERLIGFHEGGDSNEAAELVEMGALGPIDLHEALHGTDSFDALCEMYRRQAGDGVPFLDYFWSWRSIHIPLFRAMAAELPRCDVYHALCTGYAGFMAALARRRTGRAFLLTEHGVYSSERRDELWEQIFKEGRGAVLWDLQARRLINGWWDRVFCALSKLAYAHADRITSIATCGRRLQVQEGADPDKIEVVWAGIDLDRIRAMRRDRAGPHAPFTVALVGRIVPVKDVKNFLHMGAVLAKHRPDVRLLIVGPVDHDDGYVRECRRLACALGVQDHVQYTGEVDIAGVFGEIDVIVLSSLREVVPRVLMEGNGCGIPVVATDVGACREMLEGRSPEDRALGPSGVVVPLGSPGELARAVLALASDPDRWRALSRAGIERVERFYDEREGWRRYRRIYEELAARDAGVRRERVNV